MMYLPTESHHSATELRHTAATISYAGQLLLGPAAGPNYESKSHNLASTVVGLQSVYDLQMEQRW